MLPFIPFMTLGQSQDGCLKGKRIVLIEEDAVTEWQLEKALKRAGLDIVATADNRPKNAEFVLEHQPDLVIIDCRQSFPDSLEMSRHILEKKQVCIILLTDRDDEADREQARQLGICGYLVKPLTGHVLTTALEQAYSDFRHART